jgi:pyridoxamine---pyruvate transaminase
MLSKLPKEAVINLSPGPVTAYPRVLRALSRPAYYDYDPYFLQFYENVALKAAKALRTKEPALILQCEPAPAIEAAAASMIGRNDVVLNLASGIYGKGFGYWAQRYNKEMVEIEVAYDDAITPDAVAEAFRKRPDIKVVHLVHHETPSGTINPAHAIGKIARDHDALLLVDAVSSFGGMDVHPEDCAADIFITSPGKCLGGVPGVTLIAVSDRAWRHMESNPTAPRASMLSLLDWKDAWRKEEAFPFTPSTADINGLDATLDLYMEEGPKTVWARHALTAKACRSGIQAMGLTLWPKTDAIASPTATVVRVPDAVNEAELVTAARAELGVCISGGRGELKGQLIRIGHMGPMAEPVYGVVAVTAIGHALRKLGRKVDVGAGVEAALTAIARGSV